MMDALVVGFGLAGLGVVQAMERRGLSFVVVDAPLPHAGSPVAAGLMLPITGRRWVLRPHYDDFLAAARQAYGARMNPVPVSRLLSDPDDPHLNKRRSDEAYDRFLGDVEPASEGPLRDVHGRVSWTGHYVDVPALLASERQRLTPQQLREEAVDLSAVQLGPDGAVYDGESFRWLIVCTGFRAIGVPPFEWLRYRAARGEWCELEPMSSIADGVYERRHWLHVHDGIAQCGSTYDWHDLTAGTTAEGAQALTAAAESLVECPVRVVRQFAGVRAPSMDRWPYAGRHPDGLAAALLCGLGSTGLLTAPLCADHLVASLFEGAPIPPWLDLIRRNGRDAR